MHSKSLWVVVIVSALLVLSVGISGALAGSWLAPDAPVAGKINYQGRLTTPGGAPLSGAYTMRFQLYDDPTAGALLWDSGSVAVSVSGGLFNVELNIPAANFDGRGLWLALTVGGELLSPRQELAPVPYAMSLKPGAKISGPPDTSLGGVVDVSMTTYDPTAAALRGYVSSTGTAVYGDSINGVGVSGHSHNTYGVQGTSFWGWGGRFYSQTGYGLSAQSGGTDHWDHAGVFRAAMGNAVYAVSTGNAAIRGEAGSSAGSLSRPGGAVGVVGLGDLRGVWGSGGTGEGVYGVSNSGYGVYAVTNLASNNYGLYTPDNIYSLNYHLSGALMRVVQNGGADALETGDVVAFAGITAPMNVSDAPMIRVSRTATANSTAVAGVVYARFNIRAIDGSWKSTGEGRSPGEEAVLPGPIAPGEYLLMVTQGPAQVKVDAAASALQPGDLLSTASTAGSAGRAARASIQGQEIALPGTVFGKALERPTADRKTIYVYVSLQ
jgi:hypothetical protein